MNAGRKPLHQARQACIITSRRRHAKTRKLEPWSLNRSSGSTAACSSCTAFPCTAVLWAHAARANTASTNSPHPSQHPAHPAPRPTHAPPAARLTPAAGAYAGLRECRTACYCYCALPRWSCCPCPAPCLARHAHLHLQLGVRARPDLRSARAWRSATVQRTHAWHTPLAAREPRGDGPLTAGTVHAAARTRKHGAPPARTHEHEHEHEHEHAGATHGAWRMARPCTHRPTTALRDAYSSPYHLRVGGLSMGDTPSSSPTACVHANQ